MKVILLAKACESKFSFLSLGPRHCHCTLLFESLPYTRKSEVFWIKVCLMLIAINDETKKKKRCLLALFFRSSLLAFSVVQRVVEHRAMFK